MLDLPEIVGVIRGRMKSSKKVARNCTTLQCSKNLCNNHLKETEPFELNFRVCISWSKLNWDKEPGVSD